MTQPAPPEHPEAQALLARISERAAQTVRESAAKASARAPAGGESPRPPDQPGVRYGRRRSDPPRSAPQVRTLNEHAVALLQILPAQIRLAALRGSFPRIVNHIAAVWDDPRAFDNYIDSLLIDTRGKRQGFPFPVIAELAELRTYHLRHVRSGLNNKGA